MNAAAILEQVADEQGWDDASIILVLLRYIDNQQDDAGFEDFLRRQQ